MLPVGLLLTAAVADASSHQVLAFYALLAAVPAVAVAALDALGDVLDRESPLADETLTLQALLWGAGLALIVVGASTRASILFDGPVTRLADSALVACLGILCAEGIVALVGQLRQPGGVTKRRARS